MLKIIGADTNGNKSSIIKLAWDEVNNKLGIGVAPVPQTSLKIDHTFTATNFIATSNVFGVARMNWGGEVTTDAYSVWGCTIVGDNLDTSRTTGDHIGVGGEALYLGRNTQALSKAVQGRVFVGYPSCGDSANILTDGAALYAQIPYVDHAHGSQLTNAYGLYIAAQNGTGIGKGYSIYQSDANDVNYFAGKTGIGTNSPVSLLHVAGNGSTKSRFEGTDATVNSNTSFWNYNFVGHEIFNRSNDTNVISAILFAQGANVNSNSAIAGIQEVSNSLGALAFYTGGSGLSNTVPERVRIKSDGSVGIGTITPNSILEIRQDRQDYSGGLTITNGYNWGFGSSITFRVPLTGANVIGNAAAIEQGYEAANNYYLSFKTTNAGILADRVRITSPGKVGINITSPTAYLHLPASTPIANTASLKIDEGVLATTPVSGNIESDGTHLYWTDSNNIRHQLDN